MQEEDIIYVCNNCKVAIHREIKEETHTCPECADNNFKQEKSIETGNIFRLKDKFTAPFGFNLPNEEAEKIYKQLISMDIEVLFDDRN